MKTKKTQQTTVHDLRDIDPVRVAVPDVSGKPSGANGAARLVSKDDPRANA